jgi:hypothetical protein
MMKLVHTVIASRAALHVILNKVEMLFHKGEWCPPLRGALRLLPLNARVVPGFFDDRDRTSLEHVIGERMLQLEKAFDHGPVRLAYRETVRKIFHRNKSTAVPPDLSVSGMLRRVSRSLKLLFVPICTHAWTLGIRPARCVAWPCKLCLFPLPKENAVLCAWCWQGASRTYSFHASPPLHGPDDTTNSDRPNSAQEALPGMVSSHQNAPARRLPSLADAPKLPKGDP